MVPRKYTKADERAIRHEVAATQAQDSLSDDLYHYLVDTLHSVPPPRRSRSCWVMNREWELECRKLADTMGYALMPPPARFDERVRLLGLPLMVAEDGGAPHLIAD